MSTSMARWALSPRTAKVHLLGSDAARRSNGGLTARCGALLPAGAIQHERRPEGASCRLCSAIYASPAQTQSVITEVCV